MNWRDQAACVGSNPELWFSDHPAEQKLAVRICHTCPLAARAACLEYALTHGVHDGIWSGKSFSRKLTKKQQAASVAA